MHDFMHDLAVKVSGSSSTTFDSNNKFLDESKSRHVAIGDMDCVLADPTLWSKVGKMRTLLFQCDIQYYVSRTMCFNESTMNATISSLKLLRTLCLERRNIDVVPSCITKLKHLRYLDLSGNRRIKKLPDSIIRLQNLHTLRLVDCFGLEELPRDIKKLVNLRHLENKGCFGLTHMPRGLGQLTNLMTLSLFVVNSGSVPGDSGGLDELNGLNSLKGKLEIRRLVHGKDVASEYKAANLKDKQHLHTLKLEWIGIAENVVDDDTQLEGLEPHPNLKKLSLKNYGGVRFPNWHLLLTNLVRVRLKTLSHGIQHLTALQKLLGYCNELDLGKDEDWMQWLGLKSLHCLEFFDLPKLVSLPSGFQHLSTLRELMIDSCHSLTAIPEWIHKWTSLEKFTISNCSSLTSLPEGMRHLTSLRMLTIDGGILLRRCKEGTGEDWPKVAHIPDLILKDSIVDTVGIGHHTSFRKYRERVGILKKKNNNNKRKLKRRSDLEEWPAKAERRNVRGILG
ncbi:putative disease resistance protein RGA1 [Morella rubra]|uniref:Putative disease resistance protein RGA1 n=1 Tax=Morella rubra TaxID=262757 RepID=A0A6A1W4A6_9ROSI|nr:putative disease resistance protein RGA1 [Morella rubra]